MLKLYFKYLNESCLIFMNVSWLLYSVEFTGVVNFSAVQRSNPFHTHTQRVFGLENVDYVSRNMDMQF